MAYDDRINTFAAYMLGFAIVMAVIMEGAYLFSSWLHTSFWITLCAGCACWFLLLGNLNKKLQWLSYGALMVFIVDLEYIWLVRPLGGMSNLPPVLLVACSTLSLFVIYARARVWFSPKRRAYPEFIIRYKGWIIASVTLYTACMFAALMFFKRDLFLESIVFIVSVFIWLLYVLQAGIDILIQGSQYRKGSEQVIGSIETMVAEEFSLPLEKVFSESILYRSKLMGWKHERIEETVKTLLKSVPYLLFGEGDPGEGVRIKGARSFIEILSYLSDQFDARALDQITQLAEGIQADSGKRAEHEKLDWDARMGAILYRDPGRRVSWLLEKE